MGLLARRRKRKSTAEIELATARRTLGSHLDALEKAGNGWPAFSETEVAVKILKKEVAVDLKRIKTGFNGLNTQRQDWIAKIRKEQDAIYFDPKIDLGPIGKLIGEKRKAERKLVDPTPQIRALNGAIDYLEQKQQASRLLAKIKKYCAWLRWANAVSSINLPTARGNAYIFMQYIKIVSAIERYTASTLLG